jgi:Uma2 family endonuclease
VYGEASFQIGSRERIPDVAFVALDRIPPEGEPETKWPFAPDLAVEVISPNDIFDEVLTKMREYFAAGVKEVWLISTEHRLVIVHHSVTHTDMLEEDQELTCEALLPGFRCRVADLFKSPVPA